MKAIHPTAFWAMLHDASLLGGDFTPQPAITPQHQEATEGLLRSAMLGITEVSAEPLEAAASDL